MSKSYLEQIYIYCESLPSPIVKDINSRITDWLASGGNANDAYIEQQLRYAKNWMKYILANR